MASGPYTFTVQGCFWQEPESKIQSSLPPSNKGVNLVCALDTESGDPSAQGKKGMANEVAGSGQASVGRIAAGIQQRLEASC